MEIDQVPAAGREQERSIEPFSSLQALARYSGDPWTPENAYFEHAEPFMDALWQQVIWPFIRDCDFSRTVDLAAGKGRNSTKLLEHARELVLMDINPPLVEHCRQRFAGRTGISFQVGTGFDLQPLPDEWATLVYCFDAMVHFDSDVVRSYLRDLRRVLVPGGRAFLHHSNLTSAGSDWRVNPAARNFMSKELLAHYARKEGLEVLVQREIGWEGVEGLDCLSLLARP